MDSFGNYPQERPFDPFSVMLFKALQVVAFLFFIALLVMNPEAKQGKIDTKAEFIITLTWPDNHPDDIDLYTEDPLGPLSRPHGRNCCLPVKFAPLDLNIRPVYRRPFQ